MRRPALLMGLAMSAVMLIAACDDGSDDELTVSEAWASDVCGAVASWEGSISTIATDFSDGLSKEVVTEKIDEAVQATQDLAGSLRDIGAPETEAGDEAKAAIGELADTIESGVDSIKAEAETLADSGAAGVTSGVAEIATDLTTLIESGQATLEQIQGLDAADELKAAIENDETCQSLKAE